MVEWVAKDFQGELGANSEDIGGSIDKRQLRLLLFRFFRRPNAPTVVIRSIDVEVAGSNASAKVLALLAQGGAQAQATRADALKLDLKLEKRDSDWWVVRAKRTPIDPSTLLLGE